MAAVETPWSETILDQLAETEIPVNAVYCVVAVPTEGHPFIVEQGFSATETGAVIVQEDWRAASTPGAGEILVVKLADLQAAAEAQADFEAPVQEEAEPVDEAPSMYPPALPEHQEAPVPTDEDAGAPTLDDEREMLADLEAEADALEARAEEEEIEAEAEAPSQDEVLFDAEPFKRATVDVDGKAADVLKVSFAGSVELDPNDPFDRERFEALKLGHRFAFLVEGRVARKVGGWKENADGITTVTGQAALKVDSVTFETD